MKIILVSKCSLDIGQYVEFQISVLISPSKSLISSRWVTNRYGDRRNLTNQDCLFFCLIFLFPRTPHLVLITYLKSINPCVRENLKQV